VTPLLQVEGLRTVFRGSGGDVPAVDGVSLDVARGRTLGIVGESGCGKSMLSLSVMRLVPPPGRVARGACCWTGQDLAGPAGVGDAACPRREGRDDLPGADDLPQPRAQRRLPDHRGDARPRPARRRRGTAREGIAALRRVRIPAPERRMDDYPHQLSGGMRQRVMIAMALACQPRLLIADEPTTALDVTVQAQILDLLRDLQQETGMSIILITHDLGVVAEMADEVAVMYAGKVIERASPAPCSRIRSTPTPRPARLRSPAG
jgi:peptide/nickel transport system ATP-binding protein/oligopeptide transport system ATP-binding protein